ncbi:LamG-like jellyroll fold domain-containing protein, partial [Tabrizicola sp.]|uniref:LamG-like jellyroll fold domain-containing protein n=1 Tax=Tabrizicola sp. TaxID=2005166 RepID=UPI002733CA41
SGWHHVAVVAPDANVGSAPTFYINGVAVGTSNLALTSGGPASGDGSPIRVGRRADGAGQLTGAIDDVRIYGRALPASDVALLHAYTGAAVVAPQITTQPASQTVNVGASVTFTAAASGSPAPTFQWRKNGTNLAGATNAALTLPAVTAADAASYTLVATNAAGAATSNAATLTVTTSGDLTTALLNHWRMDEGTGTLAADSAGSAHGTILNGPTWTSGRIGPFALRLSAATGSHVVANQPSDAPYVGALTLAAWINVSPGAGDAVVASKVSANGAQNNPFDFIVLGSGALYFVRANGSYCAWASTATLGSGWHHVAVVAPDANVGSAPTFYINGVAVGTSNLALTSGGPASGDGS